MSRGLLLRLCAALREVLQRGESPYPEPTAESLFAVSVHLGYHHTLHVVKRRPHLLVRWGKTLTVATPWEGEGLKEYYSVVL